MAKDLGKVEQSPADDRSYRALELDNGLQASIREGRGEGGGEWTACVIIWLGYLRVLCCRVGCCGCLDSRHILQGSPFSSRRPFSVRTIV